MKELTRTEFGNPILRETAQQLNEAQILSIKIQNLIANMRHTLIARKFGVGLAAPQVGQSIALTVIVIQPTKHRPDVKPFKTVLINPVIVEHHGRKFAMWEGCLSGGSSPLFAEVPRYKKVTVTYQDESAKQHTRTFEGLRAQVIQHEVDHLNGILFVDRVKNTKSFMTLKEYKKRVVKKV